MKGLIFSVNISMEEKLSKDPQARGAYLGRWGFEGDRHNQEMRRSFSKRNTFKPNIDRQVTLFSQEVITAANEALGLSLVPGSVGENITTWGLSDLSRIPDGARIGISDPGSNVMKAVLRIDKQNQPCHHLRPLHRRLAKILHGRRGLLCVIESGHGVGIYRNDVLHLL